MQLGWYNHDIFNAYGCSSPDISPMFMNDQKEFTKKFLKLHTFWSKTK